MEMKKEAVSGQSLIESTMIFGISKGILTRLLFVQIIKRIRSNSHFSFNQLKFPIYDILKLNIVIISDLLLIFI